MIPHPGARRYEVSTLPSALVPGWLASLAWLEELGLGVGPRPHAARGPGRAGARWTALPGVRVLTPPGGEGGLVTFTVDGADPEAAADALAARGRDPALGAAPQGAAGSLGFFTDDGGPGPPGARACGRCGEPRAAVDTVRRVSERLVIRGGRALSGTLVPSGNKNAALPILAACLLTDEEVVLENVPDILDVHVMLALLDDLGVSRARGRPQHAGAALPTEVRTTRARPRPLPPPAGLRAARRPAAGPVRRGASCPCPGGDFIGRRRVDTHLLGLPRRSAPRWR